MQSSRLTRILCVNCNICVNSHRRHRILDQNTRVCSLICNWVYPQIITDDDFVCDACWELALAAVNDSLQHNTDEGAQAGPSPLGHSSVCLLCGRSLLRRQAIKVVKDNPTELEQNIQNIIQMKIAPRQVTPTLKVCNACWLRTKREALRMNRVDEIRLPESTVQNEIVAQIGEPLENPAADETRPISTITLPDYRRAANTGNHCVFPQCANIGTLHGISDKLRAIILSNHKYYLPKLARVCRDHLSHNTWDTLYESQNSINTFNAEQVQHIFSFVNAFNPALDFENIQEMDENVFEYWVGMSKEKFYTILEEVPRILEIKQGGLGLVCLLIKMRTGDSDERIASLVQKPRRSLERYMNHVRHILIQDFVPRYLGVTHLPREQLMRYNLTIPSGLYGNNNNAIVICDGTYFYNILTKAPTTVSKKIRIRFQI